jgi:hypothetical protein
MQVRFPETVQFKAPAGFTSAVETIAAREHMSVSEVLRRGMLAHLRQLGAPLEPAERSERHGSSTAA